MAPVKKSAKSPAATAEGDNPKSFAEGEKSKSLAEGEKPMTTAEGEKPMSTAEGEKPMSFAEMMTALAMIKKQLPASTEDEKFQAQEMIYEAWETRNRRTRIAIANTALAFWPDCADALCILAEDDAEDDEHRCELYESALAAGEAALGPGWRKRYRGGFWGVLETRPYMRARAALALVMQRLGDFAGAVGHFKALLKLNPGDNQGVRYLLIACYAQMGERTELAALLRRHRHDISPYVTYTSALLAFERLGSDSREAAKAAMRAIAATPHVPRLLAGKRKIRPGKTGYLSMGDTDEATDYCAALVDVWRANPRAIAWLTQLQALGAPPANMLAKLPTSGTIH